MEELKAFIENEFPHGIQMFNTRNIVGDYMENIYFKNGIVVDYCPRYDYIEIFGLKEEQFRELVRKYDPTYKRHRDWFDF